MHRLKNNKIFLLCASDFIYFLVAAAAITYVLLQNGTFDAVYFWLSAALVILTLLSSLTFKDTITSNKMAVAVTVNSGLLSLFFLILTHGMPGFPFWLLGCISTAAMFDTGLGLFFGFFMLLQAAYLGGMTTVVYFLHVICIFYLCLRLRKIKERKEIIYIDTITTCTILCVYIVGQLLNIPNIDEKNLFFIIITYIILITFGGFMKLTLKGKKNTTAVLPAGSAESAPNPAADLASGIGYLNEMAEDLSRRESDVKEPADMAALLKAEIDNIQVEDVETITDYAAPAGLSPERDLGLDYSEVIAAHSGLLQGLKAVNKHAYMQSMRVAALSEEGSKKINANSLLTKAIASFYQAELGEADFPEKLCTSIAEVNQAIRISSQKESAEDSEVLTSKESAYVFLAHQIATVFFYLKASKKADISVEKIVDKALSAAILNGYLNNSGLSLKECSEIRKYFVDKLRTLM